MRNRSYRMEPQLITGGHQDTWATTSEHMMRSTLPSPQRWRLVRKQMAPERITIFTDAHAAVRQIAPEEHRLDTEGCGRHRRRDPVVFLPQRVPDTRGLMRRLGWDREGRCPRTGLIWNSTPQLSR